MPGNHWGCHWPSGLQVAISNSGGLFGVLAIQILLATTLNEFLFTCAGCGKLFNPAPAERPRRIQHRDLIADVDEHHVFLRTAEVHLTPTEFALLRELATSPGKLLTHAVLLRRVWGPGYETETEYTRVYVRRLRAKLEDADGPPLIITEPRAGYRMPARAE